MDIKNIRLSTLLVASFSSILIITLICLYLIITIMFAFESKNQNKLITDKKLNLIDIELTKNYDIVIENIKKLRIDSIIGTYMKEWNENNFISETDKNSFSERLFYYSKNNFITSIIPIDKNKIPIDNNFENKLLRDNLLKNSEIDKFISNDDSIYISTIFPQIYKSKYNNLFENTLTILSKYNDFESFIHYGYMLININKKLFYGDIPKTAKESFDTLYIVNSANDVLFQSGTINLESILAKKPAIHFPVNIYNNLFNIDSKVYLFYEHTLDKYPDYKIIGIINLSSELKASLHFNYLFIIILFVLTIITIIVTFFIIRYITRPIKKIYEAMLSTNEENFFSKRLSLESAPKELVTLTDGFNNMIENIQNLINDIRSNEQKTKKLELYKLQSEIDLLQSQMNPHFIHNTLNALLFLSIKHGTNDISEMIKSFNILLRGTMDVQKKFVTLKEEFLYLEGYINLHKYRYSNSFTLSINCSSELYSTIIPKLILQPLVENAIYHGIIPKTLDGLINIEVYSIRNNKSIQIDISDNGTGIPEEKISSLFYKKNKNENSTGFNHITLYNIKERLHLIYGENYNITASSEFSKGTTISIIIPYNKGD